MWLCRGHVENQAKEAKKCVEWSKAKVESQLWERGGESQRQRSKQVKLQVEKSYKKNESVLGSQN